MGQAAWVSRSAGAQDVPGINLTDTGLACTGESKFLWLQGASPPAWQRPQDTLSTLFLLGRGTLTSGKVVRGCDLCTLVGRLQNHSEGVGRYRH